MATEDTLIKGKCRFWRTDLTCENYLGSGSYGVVYRTKDLEGKDVAAKLVDTTKHPRILGQDVQRLLELDHKNILKIFDIAKKENKFWMFMEFSSHGDLHSLYKEHHSDLKIEAELTLMIQIAQGVAYLHDNKIVHRDIKPANILVTSMSPLVVKLSDFDFSKFLDQNVKTSKMSSNIGTLAFIAPEFFAPDGDGHIIYHRNVDVFSTGLTYLAMIQERSDRGKLIPRIETPRDDGELFSSVGQLIAERIKYKVQPLDVVDLENVSDDTVKDHCNRLKTNIKMVIKRMTCHRAPDRLKAHQVLTFFRRIEQLHKNRKGQGLKTCHKPVIHMLTNCSFELDQYYDRLNAIIQKIEPLNLRWDVEEVGQKFRKYLISSCSKYDHGHFVHAVHCTVQRQQFSSLDLDEFKRIVIQTLETESIDRAQEADTTGECSSATPEAKSSNSCKNNLPSMNNNKFGKKNGQVMPKFTAMTKTRKRGAQNNYVCCSCTKDQNLKCEHSCGPPCAKQKGRPNETKKLMHKSLLKTQRRQILTCDQCRDTYEYDWMMEDHMKIFHEQF